MLEKELGRRLDLRQIHAGKPRYTYYYGWRRSPPNSPGPDNEVFTAGFRGEARKARRLAYSLEKTYLRPRAIKITAMPASTTIPMTNELLDQ